MLKKNINFTICDKKIILPINFQLIEVVERIYDMNVDYVAGILLRDLKNIKISKLCDVICEFVDLSTSRLADKDVRDFVYQCDAKELTKIIAVVQSVCLYMRKYISEEEMELMLEENEVDDSKKNDGKTPDGP